jgi:DNA-directed RNA polymerase beta' subunit
MNLHIPQSLEAEVELRVNARCANHIVTAQRNGPVNAVTQDGLVSSFILTMTWEKEEIKLTMVDREDALQIYKDSEISEERIQSLYERG